MKPGKKHFSGVFRFRSMFDCGHDKALTGGLESGKTAQRNRESFPSGVVLNFMLAFLTT